MGICQLGAPLQLAAFLRDQMGLTTFVEGGTFKGGTAIEASKLFSKVITIEKSEEMQRIAEENLQGYHNVTLLRGDTRSHLPVILEQNDDLVYWLDAHWSGGVTYGQSDECPLIEELNLIFAADKNQAILIDDARMFLAPPPLPHRIDQWPSMNEIVPHIPSDWKWFCADDVIHIVPDRVTDAFRSHLQRCETDRWQNRSKRPSLFKRAGQRLIGKSS